MCDSDDDEFLSASEGEFDEFDEKKSSTESKKEPETVKINVKPPDEVVEMESISKETAEKVVEKKELKPIGNIDTGSSQESLLDEKHFSASVSSGSESQPDSLSSEKRRLLAEVVKETLPDLKETLSKEDVPKLMENTTDSEKLLDEGGWDEFDVETEPSEETPKKTEESEGGWDDWGENEKKDAGNEEETKKDEKGEVSKKKSTDGWNDWSLIDEKKVEEATPKKELDPSWLQEQSNPPKVEKKGWRWTGIVSAVGETFSSTIESSLGLPSAEEVARRHSQQQKEMTERLGDLEEEPSSSSATPQLGFGMLSGLVSGGIDVLESIGKKTFEAVTIKDDKAGRRRMFFTDENGQNLSDVLRELREKQDREIPFQMGSAAVSKQQPDVASQFGRSEGMAHLEALEMLSNNRPKALPKFEREFLSALTEADSERIEDGDFNRLLSDVLKRINLPYEPKTLLDCDSEIANRLGWCDGKSSDELFSDSVQSLVEFTAASVQVVSKLANLLLILRQDMNYQDFVNLFTLLAQRANFIASQYTDHLAASSEAANADELATQTLVECSTAVDFIQQAHRLLCPMFQNL